MSRTKQPPRQQGRGLWVSLGVGVALLSLAALALFYKSLAPAKGNAATSSGHPRLTVNHEKIDLGDVKLGQTVEAAFELTNAGDAPLTITDTPYIEVVAGC
jgi:hypothetical protein